jgi:hypothetical protein
MIVQFLPIFLADGEYGNEKMKQVASEAFAKRPEEQGKVLVVEVHEHAGWYLTYLRDGTIVGTANDMASFSDEAKRFHAAAKGATYEYLPSIRR